jgi:hypothetical protein
MIAASMMADPAKMNGAVMVPVQSNNTPASGAPEMTPKTRQL